MGTFETQYNSAHLRISFLVLSCLNMYLQSVSQRFDSSLFLFCFSKFSFLPQGLDPWERRIFEAIGNNGS